MSRPSTPGALLGAIGLALAAGATPSHANADVPSAQKRKPPVNAAGQPVRTQDGAPIVYPQGVLAAAPGALAKPSGAVAKPLVARPAAPAASGATASWTYAAYGSDIGGSGLVTAMNGNHAEVYASGSTAQGSYWYALQYARDGSATQVFVSDVVPQGIRQIALAQQGAGLAPHIVLVSGDGILTEIDQATRKVLSTTNGPCYTHGGIADFTTADMNADGVDEFVSLCYDGTLAVTGSHYTGWSLAGVGGYSVAVANMDSDPALEIATGSGKVVDGKSHKVQWTWPSGFGYHLRAADLGNGSGYKGLIATSGWSVVTGYDVARQLPVWTIGTPQDVGALALGDVDGDGVDELLIGDGQWGQVKAYDIATQAQKGAIANPEHGVTNILVADVTGDGKPDVLWGAGASSSGPDFLYTADWAKGRIVWQNPDLQGPFLGPLVGDLDGDGLPEFVIASASSDAGYDSGRLLVFDGRTKKLRAISPFLCGNGAWGGIGDLKLRDLGDGRLSILVAGSSYYDGMLEAWKFNADNTFTRTWTNATHPDMQEFASVDAADIDGDGQVEIVGGGQDTVFAYDGVTGAQKWQSLQMQGGPIGALALADLDGDGAVDVAAQGRNGYIYVLAGETHAVEALIQGPTRTMSLTTYNGAPALLLGGSDGHLGVWQFNGRTFVERKGSTFGTSEIAGADMVGASDWWIGQDGVVTQYRKGAAAFSTANYGLGFGRDISFLPGRKDMMLSGGSYGVFGFNAAP